jgi:hypothetical protein
VQGGPGGVSRWVQRTMNVRRNARIRRGRDSFMGMDVLILHTVGKPAQPRYGKYQRKSDREYPVVRLTPR